MPIPKGRQHAMVRTVPKPLYQLAATQVVTPALHAGTGTGLAGGSGSWANPSNATGGDNDTYAIWTTP